MKTITPTDSLCDVAYSYIQNKMLEGALSAGSMIAEQALAKEIGISRTPVREAVKKLEREGFVSSIPRYGTTVRMPSEEEISELYELRLALETYCAAKAARMATPTILQQLSMLNQNLGQVGKDLKSQGLKFCTKEMFEKYLALDMAFHMVIVSSAENKKINNLLQETRIFTRIFCSRRNDECGIDSIAVAYRAHAHILKAIQNHDSEAARNAAAEHIELSRDRTLVYYREKQGCKGEPFQSLAMPKDLLKHLEGLI